MDNDSSPARSLIASEMFLAAMGVSWAIVIIAQASTSYPDGGALSQDDAAAIHAAGDAREGRDRLDARSRIELH